jgi:hypothetical protein
MAACAGGMTEADSARHDKVELVLADDAALIRRALVLDSVIVIDIRGRNTIERSAATRRGIAKIGLIGITEVMAMPVM